jgi:hypothetical protein
MWQTPSPSVKWRNADATVAEVLRSESSDGAPLPSATLLCLPVRHHVRLRRSCPPPVRALRHELGQGGAWHVKEDLDVCLSTVWTPEAAGQPGEGKGTAPGADQRFHAQRRLETAGVNLDDAPVVATGAPQSDAPAGLIGVPKRLNGCHKNK